VNLFESRVMRRYFGPKKEDVTREWRTLHNEGLHNGTSLPKMIKVIE
jgi:hypothetical protein